MEAPEPAHALIGELVDDRYRVGRLLGRGGMGAVYEAEAVRLGRLCAFKVLLPEYTRNDIAVQRFRREALVASRVKHPHVVDIFDTGTTRGGLGYIAMELLQGESLGRTLHREGRLPWQRARHITLQMCRALSAAHARGVVHRDMKPDNCFRLTQERDPDFIKILDFGIAKLVNADSLDARLTATGSVVGTYSYMAFEQITGLEPDHRVDIWAVGVILYEMLTGVVPFQGQNERQIWSAIFSQTPIPIRDLVPEALVPPEVDEIIVRALAKSRDHRYSTIDALAQALERVGAPANTTPSRASPGDSDALEIARVVPPHRLPMHCTARVSPYDLTELDGADVRGDTHDSGRREVVPATDPAGRNEVPPVAERAEAASARLADVEALGTATPARSRARRWTLAGSLVMVVGVGLMLSRGREEVPVVAAVASPAVLPPESVTGPPQAPIGPSPQAAPREDEVVEVPDAAPTPEPTPLAPPIKVKKPPSKRAANPPTPAAGKDYRFMASAELEKLCNSKAIRDCFVEKQKQDEPMALDFRVDVSAGTVEPEFSLLNKSTGLATCLKKKMKSWRLPMSGAGEPELKLSCILNRQP